MGKKHLIVFFMVATVSCFSQPFRFEYVKKDACEGRSNGTLQFRVSGGTEPYSYMLNKENVWIPVSVDTTYIDGLDPANYIFYAIDDQGEEDSVFVTINSTDDCLKIYTGLTPNGDDHNDYWRIDDIELFPNNQVRIYNRWGSEVKFIGGYHNQTNRWEGTDKSDQRLPDGTYFYMITGMKNIYRGWVELTGEAK